jgi:hypothetical protein
MSATTNSIQRPRPVILGLLAAVLVVLVVWAVWPAASQPPAPSKQVRVQQRPGATETATTGRSNGTLPGQLDVRLEALKQPPPSPEAGTSRNPFRFYVKPPPPPPPPPKPMPPPPPPPKPGDDNYVAPPPPPPPPIPLKFIGIVEKQGLKVAAMSDCRSTFYGTEGQVIDGRYRLIRIGIESMVIEYVDGRGRTTVRLEGCPPR